MRKGISIKKINHLAIVVANMDEAIRFWRDSLGLKLDRIENVPEQKSEVAFFPVGDGEVELVRPTEDHTGLAKYLETHGPGMHHLCFEVEDIENSLLELKEKGVKLINEKPLIMEGRKAAFIHPKSTGGVLLELYEII